MRLGALMFAWLALGVGILFTGPASHFFGGVCMAWAHFNIEEYGAVFLVVAGLGPCVLGSSREARDHRNASWPMPIGVSCRSFIFFLSSLVAARSCLLAGLPLSALIILRQSRYAHHCRAGRQHDIKKPCSLNNHLRRLPVNLAG
jgi:hypothetical protein